MIDFGAARGIADAVLYEGYLLFPYTASSAKNRRVRWQFGVVVPRAYEAYGTGEHGHQHTEVYFEASGAAHIDAAVRFLQIQTRVVEARNGDAFAPVAGLTVDGTQHLTFEETVEREVLCAYRPAPGALLCAPIRFAGTTQTEELRTSGGVLAGRVVRTTWPLSGSISIQATPVTGVPAVSCLRVRIENDSEMVAATERGMVLRTAFVSAHTLLRIDGGAFFSPVDPPERGAALPRLANEHTWPVLIGAGGMPDAQRSPLVLSSPIILADFPQLGRKTQADAFDATEIDELLTLSVLSLSDAERAEARATDPRARAIVERAEAFGTADIARLHDGDRALDPPPAPAPRSVTIGGVAVTKGSSVRLAPKRRADAWDMFLAGKIATVQAIHQDFEAQMYVAVTVDDDPASEYHQWYGRSLFFAPDEVEPLGAPG